VRARFPIDGYMDAALDTIINIASTIQTYLPPGSNILDFGSGPGDKTAVIQYLGYKCSAYDDLQDEWHLMNNNRETILHFMKEMDIDFKLASDGYLPSKKKYSIWLCVMMY